MAARVCLAVLVLAFATLTAGAPVDPSEVLLQPRDSIVAKLERVKLENYFTNMVSRLFDKAKMAHVLDELTKYHEDNPKPAIKLSSYKYTDDVLDVHFRISRPNLEREVKELVQDILYAAVETPFSISQSKLADLKTMEAVALKFNRDDVETLVKFVTTSLYDVKAAAQLLHGSPKLAAKLAPKTGDIIGLALIAMQLRAIGEDVEGFPLKY